MEESRNKSNLKGKDNEIDSGLYIALISHQIHQDHLLWSRIQLLIAVQSGVLVAGFILREYWLGTIIMILGAFFTFGVFCLLLKDEVDRGVNQPLLDKLADRLVPMDIKKELKDEINQLEKCKKLTDKEQKRLNALKIYKERFVSFSSPNLPAWRKWATGRSIFRFTMSFFIVLDIALAVLYALLAVHNTLVKELLFPMP